MLGEEEKIDESDVKLNTDEPDKNTKSNQENEKIDEFKEQVIEKENVNTPEKENQEDKDSSEATKGVDSNKDCADVTGIKTNDNENSLEIKEEKTDDWKIEASEDEEENEEEAAKRRKGIWEPPLHVIVKLYEELDKKGVLELNWKCPGRKDLEEERREQEKATELVTEEHVVPEQKEEEPTAFDDFEEDTAMVKITPRRSTGSDKAQGSGRKRTAKMESILGNMMRHKKIDEEREQGKADTEIDPMPKSDITPRRLGKIHIRNNIDS